jgi:hypothetical protein
MSGWNAGVEADHRIELRIGIMCGRYASFLPGTVNPLPNLEQTWNMAPTRDACGKCGEGPARWLVAKKPSLGFVIIVRRAVPLERRKVRATLKSLLEFTRRLS